MPYKKFLEEYSLYRKFKVTQLPPRTDVLPVVQINMECPKCSSNQTFVMTNKYWENCEYSNYPVEGLVFRMVYLCVHCQEFERVFYIKVADDKQWLMKVGQFPSWEIKGDVNIEKLLGEHSGYYRKGLVCESQGYGIGAFGYYRRIVEEIIDGLLDEIAELLTDSELLEYQDALAKTKETIVTQEKIDLVKDLLPPILRPEGMNPLSALHSALSEGLHAESDEECLEYAETCREILIFLVNQVAASKAASKGFTDSMRKLLDKKSKKKS
ncbi:hypothetical protein DFR26_1744 [Paraperlucidibaca baekdonensis]|uniref:DUF4145 domain-containing protein n=1 Tax=Paraperlucidibaca baekdonensis TaxID=748120 RepID=A0A3E0H3W4_9GAMM|nr:hypothetical protein [Paraperlucidibaca baekdonensis]REH37958.1 hypothetical protein DFR26_1744 [Paraperlucidibaca baekdonensis]